MIDLLISLEEILYLAIKIKIWNQIRNLFFLNLSFPDLHFIHWYLAVVTTKFFFIRQKYLVHLLIFKLFFFLTKIIAEFWNFDPHLSYYIKIFVDSYLVLKIFSYNDFDYLYLWIDELHWKMFDLHFTF